MLDRPWAPDERRDSHAEEQDIRPETRARAEMRAPADAPHADRQPRRVTEANEPSLEDVLDREVRKKSAQSKKKKPWWRRVLLIGVPLLVVAAGLWFYLSGGRYVSEDDAYVQALNVSISPQVAGNVVAVDVRSNQVVKKGQELFQIDPTSYRIALAQAEAKLAQARTQVRNLIQSYRAQLQQISQAQANLTFAKTNATRQEQLVKTGAGTQAAADQARRDLDAAQASVGALQRQADAVLAQLNGNADLPIDQQPIVKQALAGLAAAKRNLANTTVYAPFEGIVTNVESIGPGSYLAPGQAAFPLVSTTDVWVEANVKETDLTYVKAGDPATLTIDAYPDAKFTGKVRTIAPASGAVFALLPAQNATGNWVKVTQRVPVRVLVDRTANSPVLRDGMSASVSIDTGHKRTLRDLWRDATSIFGS